MRNLKTLSLALGVAIGLSTMAASAASADTAIVTGPTSIHGHDTVGGGHALTAAAGIECGTANYPGTAHESTITLGFEFSECGTTTGGPVTMTDNGCEFVFTLGTLGTFEDHSAEATAALTGCDAEKGSRILFHIYNDAVHKEDICTVELPEQSNLLGLAVTDETNGHLLIAGTVSGITNYLAGGCATQASGGKAETINPGAAQLHVNMTVHGVVGDLGLS